MTHGEPARGILSAMPTPAERKALLFLAGVIVLGASVRVVRAARSDGPSAAADRDALVRQIAAVDSASIHGGAVRPPRARGTARRSRERRPPRRRDADSIARADSSPPNPIVVVDLDVASEADIESLPRIGPVLARRIIDDRMKNGAFGSLEGFERVRGVGPALAASLRTRVTFSGTARPSNAVVDPRLTSRPTSTKSPRRERKN